MSPRFRSSPEDSRRDPVRGRGIPGIREGIAAAACALVGMALPAAVDATEVDALMLYYSEGYRVSVNEGVFNLRHTFANRRTLNLNLSYDIMTGASPNGAVISRQTQTFTRPSGSGGYVVQPGAVPLDDTFQDNRGAVALSVDSPLGRRNTGTLGAHYSVEYDYISMGGNAHLTRDFNKRNTTVAAGVAYSWDTWSPQGGSPIPFSSMTPPGVTPLRRDRIERRSVYDALFGVTQVISRSTLARLNYSVSFADGYNTDPYKILSVVDASSGLTAGDPLDYVHERRPHTRLRHAIYGIVKHHLTRDMVEASYRFASDDWGVTSHTAELRYRWAFSQTRHIEPQLRYYRQSAADFYHYFLRDGAPFPEFASADYRLGEFDAVTVALKYGVQINTVHTVNVRLGYYLQMGDSSPPEAFGNLRDVDLFPDVGAYILQISYSGTFE